jgi:hypothetical protein
MKVFNLQCAHGHPFEGWFKDLAAYEGQRESGLLECPCCGSREVEKTLSAPRLNLSVAAMKIVREALSSSEDVGARFAEEARAMHAGEAPSRSIHGQTSLETARELAEEGIPVVPLPFANFLKSSLQ